MISYSGGGSARAQESLIIPKLKIRAKNNRLFDQDYPFIQSDELFVWHEAKNLKFLEYNPEVWMFTHKRYSRRRFNSTLIGETEICPDVNITDQQLWPIYTNAIENNRIVYGANGQAAGITVTNPINNDFFKLNIGNMPDTKYLKIKLQISNFTGDPAKMFIASESYNQQSQFTIGGSGNFYQIVPVGALDSYITFSFAEDVLCQFVIDQISIHTVTNLFNQTIWSKWAHPVHLNGSKYGDGSRWFAGKTITGFPEIDTDGRHTEFAFNAQPDERVKIEINPFEWFYMLDPDGENEGAQKFSMQYVSENFTGIPDYTRFGVFGYPKLRNTLKMRLAIVIDNPDKRAANPKIIGDMSDVFYLRIMQTIAHSIESINRIRFRYQFNEINRKPYIPY